MVVTNAITLIAAAQLVPMGVLAVVADLDVVLLWIAGCFVAYMSVLGVAATGRVLAARVWLAVVSAVGIVGASVLLGPEMQAEVYLLVAVTATWYVWPAPRHAVLVTLLFVASYVALLVLYDLVLPIDPPSVSVARALRWWLFSGVMLSLLGIVGWSHRQTTLTDRQLDHEHARSERLLRNVLPDAIAERLKDGPIAVADRFDAVTVLFADIVGFTSLSTKLSPERLVELLNQVFTRFDHLAALHRVEKIKTIGDAYMVVAGLPEPRTDHAEAAADMALALCATIGEVNLETGLALQVRVGMCSGPAVAGVIGIQKFAYDLWGDTVNTAARMESHGKPGRIQVTESTHELLRDRYPFVDRGTIDVKGKGPMRAYFLEGPSTGTTAP